MVKYSTYKRMEFLDVWPKGKDFFGLLPIPEPLWEQDLFIHGALNSELDTAEMSDETPDAN